MMRSFSQFGDIIFGLSWFPETSLTTARILRYVLCFRVATYASLDNEIFGHRKVNRYERISRKET
jgi:hypothetical protein